MKTIVATVLMCIYGVRGAIKPPSPRVRCYRLRYAWWKCVDRIYKWSGLPKRWRDWMLNDGLGNAPSPNPHWKQEVKCLKCGERFVMNKDHVCLVTVRDRLRDRLRRDPRFK